MPTGIGCGIAGQVFGGVRAPLPDPCPTDYSIELDGVTEKAFLLGGPDISTSDFSFSCWIKVPDVTGGGAGMGIYISQSATAGALNIGFSAAGVLEATATDTGSGVLKFTAGPGGITENVWHHIVLSVDRSANWKWYVDGVNTATANLSAIVTAFPTFALTIAYGNTAGVNYFSGHATETSMWDSPLSSADVLSIYNNMSGNQTCLNELSISSNLIRWWRMEGEGPWTGYSQNVAPGAVGNQYLQWANMDATNLSTDVPT